MNIHTTRARVSGALIVSLSLSLFSSVGFAAVSAITDRNDIINATGSDFIDWQGQGGADQGDTSGYFAFFPDSTVPFDSTAISNNGAGVNVDPALLAYMGIVQDPSPYFRNTNFTDGDYLLETEGRDSQNIPYNTLNPLSFTFDSNGPDICSFGTQIAPISLGDFTARIEAFAGGDSLGWFDVDGSSDDLEAAFLGLSSTDPVSRIEVSIQSEASSAAAAWFAINRVDFAECSTIPPEPKVPALSCVGFATPMANYPVKAKKNGVFPLKMELFDEVGNEQTNSELIAAPVVMVLFTSSSGGDAIDVNGEALPAGQGSDGNVFDFTEDHIWQFNLKSKNYTAPGEYVVTAVSGDSEEYTIDDTCQTRFIKE